MTSPRGHVASVAVPDGRGDPVAVDDDVAAEVHGVGVVHGEHGAAWMMITVPSCRHDDHAIAVAASFRERAYGRHSVGAEREHRYRVHADFAPAWRCAAAASERPPASAIRFTNSTGSAAAAFAASWNSPPE